MSLNNSSVTETHLFNTTTETDLKTTQANPKKHIRSSSNVFIPRPANL